MRKQLAVGSNGYFFINGIHVDKEDYEKEELKQKIDNIENSLKELIKKNE